MWCTSDAITAGLVLTLHRTNRTDLPFALPHTSEKRGLGLANTSSSLLNGYRPLSIR